VAKKAQRVIGIDSAMAMRRDFEVEAPFTNCRLVLNHTSVWRIVNSIAL